MPGREILRFGPFALDPGERRLSSGTGAVRLSPRAFDVLVVLVQHAGRLVTKNELLARVWPESFVGEGILTVHVSALRKALRDETRPAAYIETVARSGYRFIASVTREAKDDDSLVLSGIDRPVELYELVGRGRSHLLSGSYFDVPDAVSAFRAAIEIDSGARRTGIGALCAGQPGCRTARRGAYRSEGVRAAGAGDGQRLRRRADRSRHGPVSRRMGLGRG